MLLLKVSTIPKTAFLAAIQTNQTQNKATSNNFAVRLHLTGQGRDQAPGDDEETEIERWAAAVIEQQIGWYLHENITHKEDRQS